jgi:hypothetical protein
MTKTLDNPRDTASRQKIRVMGPYAIIHSRNVQKIPL